MPSPLVVDASDLCLTLGGAAGSVDILKDVSLTLEPGEVVAIVGPSGSGKTSLMMLIAGLETPTSGALAVVGHDVTTMDENALALLRRDHVGVVFQNFHLIPTMTARENVALPLEFAGNRTAFESADEALQNVGLGHRLDHRPGQLSGGEQQRVGLARAFVHKPALLLADEPTGNLDGETGEQIVDQLLDLARNHQTAVLLITHDNRVAARCDRRLRMDAGRLSESV